MVFIPPPIYQPPKSREEKFKNAVRREQQLKNRKLRDRPGLSKMMRNQLATTQGMSTLKLVLIFSVLGMVLNWVLPSIVRYMNPEMIEDDAKYYGTLGAICITGFFLLITLLKGFIQRNRASKHADKHKIAIESLFSIQRNRASKHDQLESQPPNAQHFDTKNPENKGLLDGK